MSTGWANTQSTVRSIVSTLGKEWRNFSNDVWLPLVLVRLTGVSCLGLPVAFTAGCSSFSCVPDWYRDTKRCLVHYTYSQVERAHHTLWSVTRLTGPPRIRRHPSLMPTTYDARDSLKADFSGGNLLFMFVYCCVTLEGRGWHTRLEWRGRGWLQQSRDIVVAVIIYTQNLFNFAPNVSHIT